MVGRIFLSTLLAFVLMTLPQPQAHSARTHSPYEDVVDLIKKNPKTGIPVQTIEELLPLLPEELRSNFTFVYQSRSPHGGLGDDSQDAVDPLHPRVILFSRDGRLSLAFTGNPEKPGYNVLESIHFNDETASFVMSQFVLPAAGKGKANGRINPAQCLRCHGSDPKPITDSYPLWPGFYGSVRDTFPKGSPELPWYRKFLKEEAGRGVYKNLNFPEGSSVTPYLDPKRYNPNTVQAPADEIKYLPNTRLGMAWTELNRKRIQRKIKNAPLYKRYRYALLSGLLECNKLPVQQADEEATYSRLYYENEDRIQRLGLHPVGPGKNALDMMEMGMYRNVAQLEYLAQVLQLDTSDWSLAFENSSLSLFDGILSSIYKEKDFYLKEDFILEILRDLSKTDAEIQPYFQTYQTFKEIGYPFGERLQLESAVQACGVLIRRQSENKTQLPEVAKGNFGLHTEMPSAQEVLTTLGISNEPYQRCVQCHEGFASLFTGRKIPFTNPEELSKVLREKSRNGNALNEEILARVSLHEAGQMPPFGERLGAAEVLDLKRYLDLISSRSAK